MRKKWNTDATEKKIATDFFKSVKISQWDAFGKSDLPQGCPWQVSSVFYSFFEIDLFIVFM